MENFFSYSIYNEMYLENMYVDTAQGNFYYTNMRPILFDQGKRCRPNLQHIIRVSKNFERFITNMGLEGPFAGCFISSSLAFNKYNTDLTTALYLYARDSQLTIEKEDISNRDAMECAEELRDRITHLSFNTANNQNFGDPIYTLIQELTTTNAKLNTPIKYKYWF